MKKYSVLLLIASFLFGCNRIVEIEIPPFKSEPSGSVLSSKIISSEPGKYIVEVDLHIVDDRSQFIRNLEDEDFSIIPSGNYSGFKFNVSKLERGLKTDYKGSYDAMFLLDQSGSIVSTDPFDSRITAANTFLDNLGKNDKVGLSAFSDYGPTIYHNTGADPEKIRQTLEFLGDDEGGGTPLYLSTYNLTTELYKMSNSTNKALIVFTDGADTNGGITPDQIIALAKEKNIQIYTVGLGSTLSNLDILSKIANETGGYFMWAEDAEQLLSYFGTLGNLLQGGASYYKLRFEINTPSPITTKRTYILYFDVKLSPVKSIKIPIAVTLP